uniref:Xylulose kinase-1 n=1 Tax=Tanacetum cinerariifolium TaxID=118510 RepID=A0A699GU98_TANCI|nr:hypothetical protein [Tanacetum cinerariifolium]
MSSLFADTHNVVAILEKSDVAEGFEQIIDFLSGSFIHYALTVNPHIYIWCIKQFWNTASVKRSADVTRLQALVDKKKIVILEVVIREILQLDDAEGVVCLPNEEIFAGLAQMGYEKPLKFYMYPRFIQLIIQNQVGDLSTHTIRFISPALTQKVFANMRRVGKGFSGVETPLFEGMLVARQPEHVAEDVANDALPLHPSHDIPSPSQEQPSPPQQPQSSPQAPPHGEQFPTHIQQILDVCSALTRRVKNLKNDNAAQKLEIIKLQTRVKRLERANQVKSSKLRRLRKVGASRRIESSDDIEDGRHAAEQAKKQADIYHIDLDHSSKVLSMQEDDSEVQEVVEVVTTAKLITDVVTAASQVSAASATISAAKPSIPAAALTVVAAYTRRRKGVIIRDPEEELSLKTPTETPKLKDKGKGMKKRPQTESEARKNMMIYLKNTAGYKMDFFKGMTYAEICLIFQARFDENIRFLFKSREEMEEEDQEIIKSINETPAQKAAKKRKLSEEAQEAKDLRKRLEVVDDKDDDVFIEATPLARKLILLVKRRYPLSRFTLEQLVNVTRLQVEEESEMSLELLRFTRQQPSESKDCQSNINAARLKLKLFKNIAAAEEITKSSRKMPVAEDPDLEKYTSFTSMVGSPGSIYQPSKVSTLQAQITSKERIKAAFKEFKKYKNDRVNSRCAEMDARLDALSIDFDKELYPHTLMAIAGHRWVFANVVSARIAKGMSEGLKHGVEHKKAKLDLAAIEAYDPEANTKYVVALQALKDLKYPLVDQLEKLKDAPIDVIMSSLLLESDSGEVAPQWIRELYPALPI